ncbi:MAG TPA: hypothetical protein VMT29_01280 [Steroidobacteraceae bacterium]|nr:hypothetical protein [Steroidobacteraceae bacterium]
MRIISATIRPTYRCERERILMVLNHARSDLEDLTARPEHIEGSPPAEALWLLEDAINMLTPDEQDTTSDGMWSERSRRVPR